MKSLLNRFSILGIFIIIHLFFQSCISSPMPGLIFTYTTQHAYVANTGGAKIRSTNILKSGKSCSIGSWLYVAYFYYGGGGSVQEAMENGGIQKISVIDRESMNIIYGLFYQECTVVWGE